MDAADVGRYGTLRVLKRLEDDIVACYPIDDEEVTIGRDPSCNLRLYYESVSSLHCKVIFRERKAFLEVLGANGLLVDGCAVFPASSPSSGPVIVPLPNNSIIEIHKKRFQFCYPPKELRPILLSTPSRPEPDGKSPGKRKLRMSMIHSAQVFSPRPSPNPRENLRILQTPLKTPFRDANRRQSSPLKRGVFLAEPEEEEDEDEDIVLVETNYPRVVEEDEDLVITEHVVFRPPPPEPPKSSQPHRVAQFPIPQAAQPPPQTQQTPRRRPHSRASLHRAVLIRSAQRTALRREMEEEEEVEEVEETINELDEDEEMEEQDLMQVDEEPKSLPRVSGWKKSLEVVKEGIGWPFRSSSVPRDVQEGDEDEDEQGQEANEVNGGEGLIAAGEENDAEELFEFYDNTPPPQGEEFAEEKFSDELPLPAPTFSSAAPALGRFMTPQAPRVADRLRDRVRYSMGGFNTAGMNGMVPGAELASSTGPRRVKIVEPWRVEDLVVPSEPDVKEEDKPTHIPSTPQRHRLTEEERRAIQERRRSALTMPDTFTPGSKRILSLSPVKAAPIPALNISIKETIQEQPEEGEEDTEVMLARMKQMVDSVKKRQSMGLRHSVGFGLSPKKPGQFSLLASDSGSQTPGTEKNLFDLAQRNDKVEALSSGDTGHDVDALLLGYSEDVNMDTEEEHDVPQQMHLQPSTFQPTGVREFFRVPDQTAVHTPRMDGMRELFRTERNTVTPTFEGIGDMLATPAGYRETIQPQPATSDGTQDSVVEEEGPTKPIQSRLRKPATLGSRLPATRRTAPRSAPARGASPLVPEDEPAPAESSTSKIGPPSRVTRKPRSKTVNNDNVATCARHSTIYQSQR
ncbi:unnamed protein product [Somion occarium]|uniref:FHA domain-containing protein n=1 Tax=Somion occarium TaxID=3059160 RepID=A0ABP1DPG8_9APHY